MHYDQVLQSLVARPSRVLMTTRSYGQRAARLASILPSCRSSVPDSSASRSYSRKTIFDDTVTRATVSAKVLREIAESTPQQFRMNSVNDFSTGWQTVSEAAMEAKLWDIAEVLIEPPPQPGQENGTQLRSASDTSQTEPFVRERPPHSEINADEDAHSKSNRTANMEQMRPNESERHNKGERRNERDEWLPPAPSRVSEALDILQDRELLVWARNDVDSPALATRQDAVIVSGQSDGEAA